MRMGENMKEWELEWLGNYGELEWLGTQGVASAPRENEIVILHNKMANPNISTWVRSSDSPINQAH